MPGSQSEAAAGAAGEGAKQSDPKKASARSAAREAAKHKKKLAEAAARAYKAPPEATRPTGHYRILIKKPGEDRKEAELLGKYNISKKPHFLLGRNEGCDIQVAHPSLSRYHCALVFLPEGFMLVDLKSASGTYLNGKRLKPNVQTPLQPTEFFTVGKSTRQYFLEWVDDGTGMPPAKRIRTESGGIQIEMSTKRKLSEEEIQRIKDRKEGNKKPVTGVATLRKALGSHFEASKGLVIAPSLIAPQGAPTPTADPASPKLQPRAPKPRNTVTGVSMSLRKEEVVYSDDSDSD
jgi:hypothetical protein